MHWRRSIGLLGLLSLISLSPGCLIGAQTGSSRRYATNSASRTAPIYDCRRNVFLSGSVCVPRPLPPPKRSPVLLAARGQPTVARPDGKLQARANIAGGSLLLRGQPSKHPNFVLLELRSTAPLAAAPCGARLFRDGTEQLVHESVRSGAHELFVTLEIGALHGLEHSVRLVAEGCGRSFELDEPARATLAQFEARFREERSKLSGAPSGRQGAAAAHAHGDQHEQL